MDASFSAVARHRNLGTTMPSGGVHPIAYLPGLLLLIGALPFWDTFCTRRMAQVAMRGTNAAVVGILAAALYNPVWTSAILNARDFALALLGFVLLTAWKMPPWIVVVLLAAGGAALRLVP